MTMMKNMLIGSAGLAALAAATPAAAQYAYGYTNPYTANRYSYAQTYGYAQPYGYAQTYGYAQPYRYVQPYGYAMNTSVATSQCTAAVQSRLYSRNGLAGILGSLVGTYGSTGRVLNVTRVTPSRTGVRVRGLATSGRMAYGYRAGYPDLSFKCDVDRRGYVRDVDIRRR
jgi:hypothetical protein